MRLIFPGVVVTIMLLSGCGPDPFGSGQRDYDEITSLRDRFEANPADRSSLESIIRRTTNYSELTRGNAVAVLGQLTNDPKFRSCVLPFAMPVYIRALGDPQQSVRHNAITSLRDLGSSAVPALPALRTLLTNKDAFIRQIAEEAITHIEQDRP